MDIWLSMIGEFGFPIAVTFYLLYRIERKLDQLNRSIQYLGKLILNEKQPHLHSSQESSVYPTVHVAEKK